MASCVRNICTKNYKNLIIGFQVTVENVRDTFFETQCSQKSVCCYLIWYNTPSNATLLVQKHKTCVSSLAKCPGFPGPWTSVPGADLAVSRQCKLWNWRLTHTVFRRWAEDQVAVCQAVHCQCSWTWPACPDQTSNQPAAKPSSQRMCRSSLSSPVVCTHSPATHCSFN